MRFFVMSTYFMTVKFNVVYRTLSGGYFSVVVDTYLRPICSELQM